jgi:hypothetical protein
MISIKFPGPTNIIESTIANPPKLNPQMIPGLNHVVEIPWFLDLNIWSVVIPIRKIGARNPVNNLMSTDMPSESPERTSQ